MKIDREKDNDKDFLHTQTFELQPKKFFFF